MGDAGCQFYSVYLAAFHLILSLHFKRSSVEIVLKFQVSLILKELDFSVV